MHDPVTGVPFVVWVVFASSSQDTSPGVDNVLRRDQILQLHLLTYKFAIQIKNPAAVTVKLVTLDFVAK